MLRRITLNGQSLGARIHPGKDQKVVNNLVDQVHTFSWQKHTDKLRFQFGGKNIFPTFSL